MIRPMVAPMPPEMVEKISLEASFWLHERTLGKAFNCAFFLVCHEKILLLKQVCEQTDRDGFVFRFPFSRKKCVHRQAYLSAFFSCSSMSSAISSCANILVIRWSCA